MSRKNRKNRTVNAAAVTDGNDRHLRAVVDAPGQQNAPSTEDKLRTALTDNPGSTTAKLAMAAGVGRSTAAKILARWDREDTAIRTAGDGPRNPDTWTVAPTNRDNAAPDSDDARPDAAATASTDQPSDHANDTDEDTTAVEGPGTTSEADDDNAATDTTDDAPVPSTDADVDVESDGTTPPADTAPMDPVDSATDAEPSPAETPAVTDTNDSAPTDKDRLRKGGLRALVEEYLTEHPGESFGPAKIGKDLVRSGGAVNNACEKLVADGYAIKTCEAPKRFAINPTKTDVPETADHTE